MRCAEWAMQQARSSGYGLMTVLVAPSFAEGCMCADCMFVPPGAVKTSTGPSLANE